MFRVPFILLVPFVAHADDSVDYVRDIKPILAQHCTQCHGRAKQQNSLRLDTAATAVRGGDSGPAIVASKANESLLVKALLGEGDVPKMPPKGPQLAPEKVALIKKWIDLGAKAPTEEILPVFKTEHWSFKGPERPALPKVRDVTWPHGPIDYFVDARLTHEDLHPSPTASPETLIRRLSFDLRGVPPTVEEIDAFLTDQRPDAYDRLIDRLLASPKYGERWGRHWLDVARYADSNGFTRDFGREIWKYRDWVIASVNADVPFDQFTIEQFAGDMLPDATRDQIIATGFHRNTLINEEGGTDKEQFRVDAVADRVNTTGVAYLGLTLGCARCHEHKYDPISQREYYQFFAFLNNCDEPKFDAPSDLQIERGDLRRRAKIREQITMLEKRMEKKSKAFLAAQLKWEETITPKLLVTLPGPLQAALGKKPDKREDNDKKLIRNYFKTLDVARKEFPDVDKIAKLRAEEPPIPTTMVLRERTDPRETHVHRRGNFLDKGILVKPQVPAVLHPLPQDCENPNRLDFAQWLVSSDNPLTPRVVMNRHWQYFFGRGIVETENDFGIQGTPPTHPKLLDWLAVEFCRTGFPTRPDGQEYTSYSSLAWSAKRMHRQIISSATYRQSSRMTPELLERDPYNKLLARQSRVRLEAEIIRDAALTASGLLTHKVGGPSVHPPQPEGIYLFTQDPKPWNTDIGEDRYRRGMYTHFWRSSPYPAMMAFDFPKSNTTCTRRVRSNTPIQSLVLANDIQFIECARALATQSYVGDEWPERIDLAFRMALGRRPSTNERDRVLELVKNQLYIFLQDRNAANHFAGDTELPTGRFAAWTAVCRVLLNLDEFVTRE